MEICDSICDCIGNTPLVRLHRVAHCGNELLLKLESLNPGGSIKDRPVLDMVVEAEKHGVLKRRGTIIEATSGNTGIGLAMVGAAKGYHVVVVLPEDSSAERVSLLHAYGAEVVLTPREDGITGSIHIAKEMAAASGGVFLNQFSNVVNPSAHRKATALEILRQTEYRLDVFVAAVGTGGTLTGIGEALKEYLPSVKVVAVEPASSPVLSGGSPGPRTIPGMGLEFIPEVLNTGVFDEVITVEADDASDMARRLAEQEGILVGPSTGAVTWAAVQLGQKLDPPKRIVAIAADNGERYLSTELFHYDGRFAAAPAGTLIAPQVFSET